MHRAIAPFWLRLSAQRRAGERARRGGKLGEPAAMLLMLIDTSDAHYGSGPHPPRGRVRRMLAGGMLCLVLAHFLPVLGGVMLAAFGLLVLVLALYIVDDEPREDA